MSESTLDLAARALSAVRSGDGAQATVTTERSLLLRFARSRPTQATAVDDRSVEVTVVCEGHAAAAATNRTDEEGLAACARAAEQGAEATARIRADADGSRGPHPGFPAPAPIRGHAGHDPETALLDPARGGTALEAAFAAAPLTAPKPTASGRRPRPRPRSPRRAECPWPTGGPMPS